MLLLRHLAGDEDAEVADVLVQQPDDHLAARLDFFGGAVDVGDPVECLLRRRDVVAHRREQDDRRLDVAQVEGLAARALGAGPELVADEQVAGDPLDLLAVHQVEAAPPALELEEARRLGVDVREQVVVLVPERVGRIEVLEVLDQIGAVEDAVAHVGRERRQPGAAQHAARVAHRVVAGAFLERAAPVRHRRAVDHDRAGVVRIGRGEHHRRPAALAIADDHRLRARRMQLAHLLHELLLGIADIEQRLAGLGIAEEDHEVDRMSLAQRDADLRIVLESADARAVAGARIDDHVRPPLRIDFHAFRRDDPHERVVDRPGKLAPVDDGLVVEVQDRRQPLAVVLDEVVAALAQRVPEQDRALREIGRVLAPVATRLRRARRASR